MTDTNAPRPSVGSTHAWRAVLAALAAALTLVGGLAVGALLGGAAPRDGSGPTEEMPATPGEGAPTWTLPEAPSRLDPRPGAADRVGAPSGAQPGDVDEAAEAPRGELARRHQASSERRRADERHERHEDHEEHGDDDDD